MKKESIPKLKKKLDVEFSKLVREKGICEMSDHSHCGGNLQHSHILPKSHYPSLRYDIINATCMCYRHHMFVWHKSPLEAMEWFKNKYPHRYDYLMKVRGQTKKFTLQDFKEILEAVKSKDLHKLVMFP